MSSCSLSPRRFVRVIGREVARHDEFSTVVADRGNRTAGRSNWANDIRLVSRRWRP
jgi:hypothetical protein